MSMKNIKAEPLEMPTVINGDDGVIDQWEINSGLVLTIPDYNDAQPGDHVEVYWNTNGATVYTVTYVLGDDIGNELPMDIDVYNTYPPVCRMDGDYDIYYTATDHTDNENESVHLALTIQTGLTPASLPAPGVPDADPGYINYDTAADGVEVDISYPDMAEEDSVVLTLQGYDAQSNALRTDKTYAAYTVSAEDVGAKVIQLTDLVTFEDMQGIGESAYALFWYAVTPSGTTSVETSATFRTDVDVVPPGVA